MTGTTDIRVEVIATGLGRCEGPVYRRDGTIVASSMSEGYIWSVDGESASVLCDAGGSPNGLVEDDDGRLYIAQRGIPAGGTSGIFPSGIQVVDQAGDITFLTYEPMRPNDLCFGPDGFLYVTDPSRTPGWDDGRIWRIDPANGHAHILAAVDWFPNGIAFDSAGNMYVAATAPVPRIYRYALSADPQSTEATVFAEVRRGHPDGIAFDLDGVLHVCAVNLGAIAAPPPNATPEAPGEIQSFDAAGSLVRTWIPGPSRIYSNIAIDDSGVAIITDTDAGQVLKVSGLTGLALPLLPSLHGTRSR